MKIYVSHASNFDFENCLYLPLERSSLLGEHVFIFPHRPEYVDVDVSELFKDCEVVFAEVSLPSTGQGIELGRASEKAIPILCAYQSDKHYSSSLSFISNAIISYQTPDQLAGILLKGIETLRDRY